MKKMLTLRWAGTAILCWAVLAAVFFSFNPEKSTYFQIKITAAENDSFQLFYSANNDFSEKMSFTVPLMKGENELTFPLPAELRGKIRHFRIDPSCINNRTLLLQKILFQDDGKTFELENDRFLSLSCGQMTCTKTSSGAVELITSGNDPQVVVPVSLLSSSRSRLITRTLRDCFFAALTVILLLGAIRTAGSPRIRELVCQWFCDLQKRGVLRWAGVLAAGCGAAFIGTLFFLPSPRVEVEIEFDQNTWIQLFMRSTEAYNQKDSFFVYCKKGPQKFSFAVPAPYSRQLSELRFDPGMASELSFKIRKFVLYKDSAQYTLPLEKIRACSYSGLTFSSAASDCAAGKTTGTDPWIVVPVAKMQETPHTVSGIPVWCIACGFFLIGAALAAGATQGGALRKYTLQGSGALIGAAILAVLLLYTVYLGKFVLAVVLLWAGKMVFLRLCKVPETPEKEMRPGFDWSMHYFRAFAISCICIGHMLGDFGQINDKFFHADSIYFLFISGFLCQYLFDRKPDPPLAYYKKKLYNVICPYLIFSIVVIIFRLTLCGPEWITHLLYPGDSSREAIVTALLTGGAVACYWYIPFVSLLFLVSPFACRMKPGVFHCTLFALAFLFMVFPQRGLMSLENWQETLKLYFFFSFAYFLGMQFARSREAVQGYFKKIFWAALGGGILLICLIKNSEVTFVMGNTAFLQGLQKYCFIVVMVPLLELIKNKKISFLNELAVYSFTIFFLHQIFHLDFLVLLTALKSEFVFLGGSAFRDGTVYTVFAFVCSVIYLVVMVYVSKMLKQLFGRFSRYFIGS